MPSRIFKSWVKTALKGLGLYSETNDTIKIKAIYIDDYGGGFTGFTPPSDAEEGDVIIAVDTNTSTPGTRLYVYANSAWKYVALS